MKRSSLPSYSVGHFLTGFTGAFLISRMSLLGYTDEGYELPVFLMILCALGSVFIAGILSDLIHTNGRLPAILGLCISASSLIVGGSSPETSAVLAGVGYAFFAVGGLTDALSPRNGLTRPAIFIFSVFPGIAAGNKAGSTELMKIQIPVILIFFIGCCIFAFCNGKRGDNEGDCIPAGRDALIRSSRLSVALATVSSFAISWAYSGISVPESESRFAWLIPSVALAAGIFAGGFFGDLFGSRYVCIISAPLGAAALFISKGHFSVCCAALFLMGAVIPSVFVLFGRIYRGSEGFAAGVAFLAALAGYVVSYYFPASGKIQTLVLPGAVALSGVLLFSVCDAFRVPSTSDNGLSGTDG